MRWSTAAIHAFRVTLLARFVDIIGVKVLWTVVDTFTVVSVLAALLTGELPTSKTR